ncbi:jg3082 [Pararge aegeria aegeria]|uniref:Jg3082 protein n=1 Tax=Pararge aegeria aegeria TaxID=348720 RepID=A0A8S4QNE4_9NEOP|nr:jg3082 [Pararge aegeria aegeria]
MMGEMGYPASISSTSSVHWGLGSVTGPSGMFSCAVVPRGDVPYVGERGCIRPVKHAPGEAGDEVVQ